VDGDIDDNDPDEVCDDVTITGDVVLDCHEEFGPNSACDDEQILINGDYDAHGDLGDD
jgi:hypothetical protein